MQRRSMDNKVPATRSLTARQATVAPAPLWQSRQIADLRQGLNLSQPVFAQALNVSPETVRAWEQGKRSPEGAALRLLEVAHRYPEALMSAVHSNVGQQKESR